jgi:tetratricopeptide (TPR) repeat protein
MKSVCLYLLAGLALTLAAGRLHAQSGAAAQTIVQFNQSLTAEAEDRYADALKDLESLPSEAKSDYLVSLRLGWLCYLNQDYDRAVSYYQQASQSARGRSIEALLGLTLPLAAKSDWTRVEESYRRVLSMDPHNYTANLRLGQIELNRGDFSQAELYLKTALENYPGEYEANLSSAWNNYYLGHAADARVLFERALMLSPGDTSATRGLQLVR